MHSINRKTFDKNRIKAILFDSGRVLNRPATGHWFITPGFFTFVNRKKFNSIPLPKRNTAFNKAGEYISKQSLILDENEEYEHFLEYYRIFSRHLPELQLTSEEVQVIAIDYVYNYNKYTFFNDAMNLIPDLSSSYKLAVVSDAWPSLEGVFKNAGLRDYFSSFVISSKKGILKPHKLMYKTALDELGILPEEAVFVDDNIKNCIGAMNVGINSYLLCRDLKSYFYNRMTNRNYNIIRNLNSLKKQLITI